MAKVADQNNKPRRRLQPILAPSIHHSRQLITKLLNLETLIAILLLVGVTYSVSVFAQTRMRLLERQRDGSLRLTSNLADETLEQCRYAILSHRWGQVDEEPTYEDIKNGSGQHKAGYQKVEFCRLQAQKDGLNYIWIDTCCIDRQSSSELSEAINSMYRWYQKAECCYVFLGDVNQDDTDGSFVRSQWFERGWTLQELLAPKDVRFFDQNGQFLGNKKARQDQIVQITGISSDVLQTGDTNKHSIAQKMSWAARRTTSRIGDRAYCLMGLFNVNMPLLYGERDRAFVRLQEEIVKESDDHSIFAWKLGRQVMLSGLIAPSPACFENCGFVEELNTIEHRAPYTLTNRGLSISLMLTPWSSDVYLARLDVKQEHGFKLCIFLKRLTEDDQYARVEFDGCSVFQDTKWVFDNENRPFRIQQLFVRKNIKSDEQSLRHSSHLRLHKALKGHVYQKFVISTRGSLVGQAASFISGGWGELVTIDCSQEKKGLKRFTMGFDFDFNPICILEDSSKESCGLLEKQTDPPAWSNLFPDNFDWNDIEEGKSYRPEDHNGVWVLRGHRIHGLDVTLMASLTATDGIWVRVTRSPQVFSCVWDVFIDDFGGVFAGLMQRRF